MVGGPWGRRRRFKFKVLEVWAVWLPPLRLFDSPPVPLVTPGFSRRFLFLSLNNLTIKDYEDAEEVTLTDSVTRTINGAKILFWGWERKAHLPAITDNYRKPIPTQISDVYESSSARHPSHTSRVNRVRMVRPSVKPGNGTTIDRTSDESEERKKTLFVVTSYQLGLPITVLIFLRISSPEMTHYAPRFLSRLHLFHIYVKLIEKISVNSYPSSLSPSLWLWEEESDASFAPRNFAFLILNNNCEVGRRPRKKPPFIFLFCTRSAPKNSLGDVTPLPHMGSVPSVRPDMASSLRRRNSISSGVPTRIDLPSKTQSSSLPPGDKEFPNVDFELIPLKSLNYTSLKDLLPSAPSGLQSPTANQSCHEISIRNRLVKQAAWAYLQPMASSPDAAGSDFFRSTWLRFSGEFGNPVRACLGFINRHLIPTISRAIDRLLAFFPFGKRPLLAP
ncbi:hypothetical protein H6P81_007931 [Aristolochia fimbriata]|uniref:Uncharacterized protein n=1 Tax=Aristolochia fimbriata TaxID=158543 RepID=A0AAV7F5G0_ARIFI|nr:hypothetical protein H6P81_007931 [Aristolochia fimbriata]